MRVFGYGSLMWDGWETPFGGTRTCGAVLHGYRRAFNKQSVTNWGRPDAPCPTLGLEPVPGETCTGCAFQFEDGRRGAVLRYLNEREGDDFDLQEVEVELPEGTMASAYTAVNDRSGASYIGHTSAMETARMIGGTKGTSGRCVAYIRRLRRKLHALSIRDDAVEAVWQALQALR
jgi:cation transport protein ChaC